MLKDKRHIIFSVFVIILTQITTAYAQPGLYYWNVEKLLNASAKELHLTDSDEKTLGTISKDRLHQIHIVKQKIEDAAQLKSDFYIVTGDKPNAFASNIMTGRNLFAINIPMIQELGDDADAYAALIGHELAHIKCAHIQQNIQRVENINTGMQVANLLLILARVPMSGLIASAAGDLTFKTFSRDQEREADLEGTALVKKAGLNPYGAVRLHQMILNKKGDTWFYITSTHPPSSERIENIKSQIANEYKFGQENESQISKLQFDYETAQLADKANIIGDRAATVFDKEERSPTLHKKIKCRLSDMSEIHTTPVDCVQREGIRVK